MIWNERVHIWKISVLWRYLQGNGGCGGLGWTESGVARRRRSQRLVGQPLRRGEQRRWWRVDLELHIYSSGREMEGARELARATPSSWLQLWLYRFQRLRWGLSALANANGGLRRISLLSSKRRKLYDGSKVYLHLHCHPSQKITSTLCTWSSLIAVN